MSRPLNPVPVEFLGELENAVAEPKMLGMSLGSTLNDTIIIDLINGQGSWGFVKWCRRSLAQWRLGCRWALTPQVPAATRKDEIMVTWRSLSSRVDELLIPVIQALGPDRCMVLHVRDGVVARIPQGAGAICFRKAIPHDPKAWKTEFRSCGPSWMAAMKAVCRRHGLPAGVYRRLALDLVNASQLFMGFRQFLNVHRPAAIVTEYDRNALWSCLVLAARTLAIPTFTLQHGVLNERAIGYVPPLADKMFCWGQFAEEELVRYGAKPQQLAIGGCPRLERRLAVTTKEGRTRLGLDPTKPVVMLATAPYAPSERTRLVDIFAGCMKLRPEAVGIVRLHPSEKFENYAVAARLYPEIRFFENREATLDESLAAADIVVTHNSGVGGDALVKKRAVIVVEMPPVPMGHGKDLVEKARCPCVRKPQEMAEAVGRLLFDEAYRQQRQIAAERFVEKFCAYFGRESAERIADGIQQSLAHTAEKYDAPTGVAIDLRPARL